MKMCLEHSINFGMSKVSLLLIAIQWPSGKSEHGWALFLEFPRLTVSPKVCCLFFPCNWIGSNLYQNKRNDSPPLDASKQAFVIDLT